MATIVCSVVTAANKPSSNFFWVFIYIQKKIDLIHEQVIRGDLRSVRKMLDKRGWAGARDHYGHSPLHKAVMANQEDVARYIVDKFPELMEVRDNVSEHGAAAWARSLFCLPFLLGGSHARALRGRAARHHQRRQRAAAGARGRRSGRERGRCGKRSSNICLFSSSVTIGRDWGHFYDGKLGKKPGITQTSGKSPHPWR